MESELFHWLGGMPWYGWVAIIAIVTGCLTSILKRHYEHAERMEMIRQGINPNFDGKKPMVPPEV